MNNTSQTGASRSLQNRVAIITGGTSGVGLECANQLIALDAKVVVIGSNVNKTDSTLKKLGTNTRALSCDIRNAESAEKALQVAIQEFDQPATLLINSAGVILREPATSTSNADWARVMDINVNGLFYFSRAFAQQNISDAAIVNVSSTCGQVGAAGLAAYCASKGAVDQLTRTMALELASRKINVNAVAPGAINSPMLFSKHVDNTDNQDICSSNIDSIPISALAEPAEVARAILFLATERHITGTIFSVDGGYTAV